MRKPRGTSPGAILGVLGDVELRNPYPLHRQKAFIVPELVPPERLRDRLLKRHAHLGRMGPRHRPLVLGLGRTIFCHHKAVRRRESTDGTASYSVPSPHIRRTSSTRRIHPRTSPEAECGWETLRWGVRTSCGEDLANIDYDTIVVLSPHWQTYVGTHFLGVPRFESSLSVDPVFPNLFRYRYDARRRRAARRAAMCDRASEAGLVTKMMRNPDFRVDYGTLVSCHLTEPCSGDKPIVSSISSQRSDCLLQRRRHAGTHDLPGSGDARGHRSERPPRGPAGQRVPVASALRDRSPRWSRTCLENTSPTTTSTCGT